MVTGKDIANCFAGGMAEDAAKKLRYFKKLNDRNSRIYDSNFDNFTVDAYLDRADIWNVWLRISVETRCLFGMENVEFYQHFIILFSADPTGKPSVGFSTIPPTPTNVGWAINEDIKSVLYGKYVLCLDFMQSEFTDSHPEHSMIKGAGHSHTFNSYLGLLLNIEVLINEVLSKSPPQKISWYKHQCDNYKSSVVDLPEELQPSQIDVNSKSGMAPDNIDEESEFRDSSINCYASQTSYLESKLGFGIVVDVKGRLSTESEYLSYKMYKDGFRQGAQGGNENFHFFLPAFISETTHANDLEWDKIFRESIAKIAECLSLTSSDFSENVMHIVPNLINEQIVRMQKEEKCNCKKHFQCILDLTHTLYFYYDKNVDNLKDKIDEKLATFVKEKEMRNKKNYPNIGQLLSLSFVVSYSSLDFQTGSSFIDAYEEENELRRVRFYAIDTQTQRGMDPECKGGMKADLDETYALSNISRHNSLFQLMFKRIVISDDIVNTLHGANTGHDKDKSDRTLNEFASEQLDLFFEKWMEAKLDLDNAQNGREGWEVYYRKLHEYGMSEGKLNRFLDDPEFYQQVDFPEARSQKLKDMQKNGYYPICQSSPSSSSSNWREAKPLSPCNFSDSENFWSRVSVHRQRSDSSQSSGGRRSRGGSGEHTHFQSSRGRCSRGGSGEYMHGQRSDSSQSSRGRRSRGGSGEHTHFQSSRGRCSRGGSGEYMYGQRSDSFQSSGGISVENMYRNRSFELSVTDRDNSMDRQSSLSSQISVGTSSRTESGDWMKGQIDSGM